MQCLCVAQLLRKGHFCRPSSFTCSDATGSLELFVWALATSCVPRACTHTQISYYIYTDAKISIQLKLLCADVSGARRSAVDNSEPRLALCLPATFFCSSATIYCSLLLFSTDGTNPFNACWYEKQKLPHSSVSHTKMFRSESLPVQTVRLHTDW